MRGSPLPPAQRRGARRTVLVADSLAGADILHFTHAGLDKISSGR